MNISAIQKTLVLFIISFVISLSVNNAQGQGFLKKLKDAANKVISPTTTAKTPPANNQNNTPANTAPANNSSNNNTTVNSNVWASDTIPKNVNPVRPAPEQGIKPQVEKQRQPEPLIYEILDKAAYATDIKYQGDSLISFKLEGKFIQGRIVKTVIGNIMIPQNSKYGVRFYKGTYEGKPAIGTVDEPPVLADSASIEQLISHSQLITDNKSESTQDLPEIDDRDKVFTKVQNEAEFPGGNAAWRKYLEQNLNINVPKNNGAPAGTYVVVVRFIVSVFGSISDIEAETKYGYGMEKEAVRLIAGSPKWIPAAQNYKHVNAYRRQPITFTVTK